MREATNKRTKGTHPKHESNASRGAKLILVPWVNMKSPTPDMDVVIVKMAY